nr:hypothetical protein [Polyangiaceae bacterium]
RARRGDGLVDLGAGVVAGDEDEVGRRRCARARPCGTGGTGATATGGTGATGTGGVANCPGTIQGQKCNALQTNVPAETACIQGQCCAAVDACLADAACSSFVACGSACLQAGGTPQTCGTQCQSCLGASSGLYTTFTTCVTNCASGDGGTTDSGTTDAGASDAASD